LLLLAISGWGQRWQIPCSVWESLLDMEVCHPEFHVTLPCREIESGCAMPLCFVPAIPFAWDASPCPLSLETYPKFQLKNATFSLKPLGPPFALKHISSSTLYLQWTNCRGSGLIQLCTPCTSHSMAGRGS
jgi:hypothetical protein